MQWLLHLDLARHLLAELRRLLWRQHYVRDGRAAAVSANAMQTAAS
jgi:hypothetical protein